MKQSFMFLSRAKHGKQGGLTSVSKLDAKIRHSHQRFQVTKTLFAPMMVFHWRTIGVPVPVPVVKKQARKGQGL